MPRPRLPHTIEFTLPLAGCKRIKLATEIDPALLESHSTLVPRFDSSTSFTDVVALCVEADRNADNVTEVYRFLVWYMCITRLPQPQPPLEQVEALWATIRAQSKLPCSRWSAARFLLAMKVALLIRTEERAGRPDAEHALADGVFTCAKLARLPQPILNERGVMLAVLADAIARWRRDDGPVTEADLNAMADRHAVPEPLYPREEEQDEKAAAPRAPAPHRDPPPPHHRRRRAPVAAATTQVRTPPIARRQPPPSSSSSSVTVASVLQPFSTTVASVLPPSSTMVAWVLPPSSTMMSSPPPPTSTSALSMPPSLAAAEISDSEDSILDYVVDHDDPDSCGVCLAALDELQIGCDQCEQWYHGPCVGVDTQEAADAMDTWTCPQCTDPVACFMCTELTPLQSSRVLLLCAWCIEQFTGTTEPSSDDHAHAGVCDCCGGAGDVPGAFSLCTRSACMVRWTNQEAAAIHNRHVLAVDEGDHEEAHGRLGTPRSRAEAAKWKAYVQKEKTSRLLKTGIQLHISGRPIHEAEQHVRRAEAEQRERSRVELQLLTAQGQSRARALHSIRAAQREAGEAADEDDDEGEAEWTPEEELQIPAAKRLCK